MTRQTFYRTLARLSKNTKWNVYDGGYYYSQSSLIREDGVLGQCPISFVANKKVGADKFDAAEAWDAAKYLGLDKEDAAVIIGSADRNRENARVVAMGKSKFNQQCREALLRATGATIVED